MYIWFLNTERKIPPFKHALWDHPAGHCRYQSGNGRDGHWIGMKVDYALDMNEEHVADCCLSIQAQSKDAPGIRL